MSVFLWVITSDCGSFAMTLIALECSNCKRMVAIKNNNVLYLADVFKMDTDFLENEEKYKAIKKGELLDGSQCQ